MPKGKRIQMIKFSQAPTKGNVTRGPVMQMLRRIWNISPRSLNMFLMGAAVATGPSMLIIQSVRRCQSLRMHSASLLHSHEAEGHFTRQLTVVLTFISHDGQWLHVEMACWSIGNKYKHL